MSLHKYLYAVASPVNNIDPSGMMSASLNGLLSTVRIGIGIVGRAAGTVLRVGFNATRTWIWPYRSVRSLALLQRWPRVSRIIATAATTTTGLFNSFVFFSATGALDRALTWWLGIPFGNSELSPDGALYDTKGNEIPPTGEQGLKQANGQWFMPGEWRMTIHRQAGHSWIEFVSSADPKSRHTVSRYATGFASSKAGVHWDADLSSKPGFYSRSVMVSDPVIMGGKGFDVSILSYGDCDTYSARIWNLNVAWTAQNEVSLVIPALSGFVDYPLTALGRLIDQFH